MAQKTFTAMLQELNAAYVMDMNAVKRAAAQAISDSRDGLAKREQSLNDVLAQRDKAAAVRNAELLAEIEKLKKDNAGLCLDLKQSEELRAKQAAQVCEFKSTGCTMKRK
jgi:hypothetical protein